MKKHEAGPHVVDGGLTYLVKEWRRVADAVASRSEQWLWEEWMNDLDKRQFLEDLVDNVPEARAASVDIVDADTVFESGTRPTETCQWGSRNERLQRWTPTKNWWYWREPLDGYETIPELDG